MPKTNLNQKYRLLLEIYSLLEPGQFHVFAILVGNSTIRVVIQYDCQFVGASGVREQINGKLLALPPQILNGPIFKCKITS
jgi:hypothetical protein